MRRSASLLALAASVLVSVAGSRIPARGDGGWVRLPGHVPGPGFAVRVAGPVRPDEPIALALSLPLRNEAGLEQLLRAQYDPGDPAFGRFLTPEEFRDRFCPTAGDYQAVAAFARSRGLTVSGEHANRLLLDVAGPAAIVERAFGTRLVRYIGAGGKLFRAPAVDPAIPANLAGRIVGIVGLDDLVHLHKNAILRTPDSEHAPRTIGTGPWGGMSPADIRTAYGLADTPLTGAGETLALFELDGYDPSDIANYVNAFRLPAVPLKDIRLDGVSGHAGPGADEVTLDIELQIALAPGAKGILVYEGKNTGPGVLDIYNRIASEGQAKEVSTSWGGKESQTPPNYLRSENTIFRQMAAQGQAVFAASGDTGAAPDGPGLEVDDPPTQPFVTAVGGTRLTTAWPGGPWAAETTWRGIDESGNPDASGGGISSFWALPSYQAGLANPASLASSTHRNEPDVSLNADPNTGYAIFLQGGWAVAGGTSASAPLWSALTALVAEARTATGYPRIGFLNPALYRLGKGAGASDYHDIADDSNNRYYPAVPGYDDATGWGSPNGDMFLNALSLYAAKTFTLGGRVTLKGKGVAGIQVTAGGATAVTLKDGSYKIPGLVNLTHPYTVAASGTGYTFTPASRNVLIKNANVSGVNFKAAASDN